MYWYRIKDFIVISLSVLSLQFMQNYMTTILSTYIVMDLDAK